MLEYKKKIAEIVLKIWMGAKTIFSPIVFEQLFKETDIEIDSKNNLIKMHDKTAKIEYDIRFNDIKGYSVGKFLWALREVLTGIKQPEMVASFPSSLAYGIEVIKHTEDTVADILEYLKK